MPTSVAGAKEKYKHKFSDAEPVYAWGDTSHAEQILMPSIDVTDEIIEWPPRDKPKIFFAPSLQSTEPSYMHGNSGYAPMQHYSGMSNVRPQFYTSALYSQQLWHSGGPF